MIRFVATIALLIACSSPPTSTLTPFQIPDWQSYPSDDEIVAAIVGSGGTGEERGEADALARAFLLPGVVADDRTLTTLLWNLRGLASAYQDTVREQPRDAFLRLAVRKRLGKLERRSRKLSSTRLTALLWPDQPAPEAWQPLAFGLHQIATEAFEIEGELASLEVRYGERIRIFGRAPELGTVEFALYRILELIRHNLYVARSGDYSITSGSTYEQLRERGVVTMPLGIDRPY
jgi:hypothetical protein